MEKIIIDTNALMGIAEFKLDLFTAIDLCCDFNYKLFVLSGTIEESKQIEVEQKGKFKRAAKLVLAILKAKEISLIPENDGLSVDDQLVTYSKKGYLVLTQDAQLKKRLHKPYLTIRRKRYVVLIT